jgi:ABC-type transport system substrate-binding protein
MKSRTDRFALACFALVSVVASTMATAGAARAQRSGGILKIQHMDTLPSTSIHEEARELMKQAGYGPDKRLKLKVSTRNIATFCDPVVILLDQLKQIYIDGELEVIDTSVYYNRVFKKDYVVALNLSGSAVDDPDVTFFEGYACGSLRNYNNYCNLELTRLF